MSLEQRSSSGEYQFQRLITQKELYEVWQAFASQKQRSVIITLLCLKGRQDLQPVSHYLQHAQALLTLQHPAIIPILDVQATADGDVFLVEAAINGSSLAAYLHATSHAGHYPDAETIVRLLIPLATALDYAHRRGIVHGMLTPERILMTGDSSAESSASVCQLGGFGLGNIWKPVQLPLEDVLYMAPVQSGIENMRDDLYALGVILYELCTGTLPFQGETTSEVIKQHTQDQPVAPALINPQLRPALTAVILKSLAKEPTARFSTAWSLVTAVARALQVSLSDAPPLAARSAEPTSSRPLDLDPMNSPTYLHSIPLPPPSTVATFISTPVEPAQPMMAGARHSDVASLPVSPPPLLPPVRLAAHSRKSDLPLVLFILTIIALLSSSLAVFSWYHQSPVSPAQPLIAGHAFFISSGLLSPDSDRGITDGMQVDVQNIQPVPPGKRDYVWLLSDTDQTVAVLPLLLGTLAVTNRHASVSYAGNQQHDNLLARYSRLLITEEDANNPPAAPSARAADWRYFAALVRTPNPQDITNHYSPLDHVRHILSQDPTVKAVGLTGGLDTWLFRNTLKIIEWSGSARDAYQAGDRLLMKRQLVRVLDYLDGYPFVQTENLPPDLPPLLVDPAIARIPILQVGPIQEKPGYLDHISNHLRGMTSSPNVTAEQKQLSLEIQDAITRTKLQFIALRMSALTLVQRTPDQLNTADTQPLLNNLFTEANNAFVGITDPNTNQVRDGVAQIHYKAQRLATLTILPCRGAATSIDQCHTLG